jgi:hypothetical protein
MTGLSRFSLARGPQTQQNTHGQHCWRLSSSSLCFLGGKLAPGQVEARSSAAQRPAARRRAASVPVAAWGALKHPSAPAAASCLTPFPVHSLPEPGLSFCGLLQHQDMLIQGGGGQASQRQRTRAAGQQRCGSAAVEPAECSAGSDFTAVQKLAARRVARAGHMCRHVRAQHGGARTRALPLSLATLLGATYTLCSAGLCV